MDILREAEERKRKSMALFPEGSNDNLSRSFGIPLDLKWGNQRFLRCMKNVNPDVEKFTFGPRPSVSPVNNGFISKQRDSEPQRIKSAHPAPEVRFSGRKFSGGDDGNKAVRTNFMFGLRNEADMMKDTIFSEKLEEESPAAETVVPAAVEETVRPWNLRKRRAACKSPYGGDDVSSVKANCGSLARIDGKLQRLRGGEVGGAFGGEKRERAKFSVSLSRDEIADDFMAILGQRLPRRPKKRPKNVQTQLDNVFPGLLLTEINADKYKVPDENETRKVKHNLR